MSQTADRTAFPRPKCKFCEIGGLKKKGRQPVKYRRAPWRKELGGKSVGPRQGVGKVGGGGEKKGGVREA